MKKVVIELDEPSGYPIIHNQTNERISIAIRDSEGRVKVFEVLEPQERREVMEVVSPWWEIAVILKV